MIKLLLILILALTAAGCNLGGGGGGTGSALSSADKPISGDSISAGGGSEGGASGETTGNDLANINPEPNTMLLLGIGLGGLLFARRIKKKK